MTVEETPERVINYAFLLGGLTAAIFGIVLLIRGEEALSLLVVLLGLWWLIQGAQHERSERRPDHSRAA